MKKKISVYILKTTVGDKETKFTFATRAQRDKVKPFFEEAGVSLELTEEFRVIDL